MADVEYGDPRSRAELNRFWRRPTSTSPSPSSPLSSPLALTHPGGFTGTRHPSPWASPSPPTPPPGPLPHTLLGLQVRGTQRFRPGGVRCGREGGGEGREGLGSALDQRPVPGRRPQRRPGPTDPGEGPSVAVDGRPCVHPWPSRRSTPTPTPTLTATLTSTPTPTHLHLLRPPQVRPSGNDDTCTRPGT